MRKEFWKNALLESACLSQNLHVEVRAIFQVARCKLGMMIFKIAEAKESSKFCAKRIEND